MFLSLSTPIRAGVDGDRSPWGGFWFQPIGARSATGERITTTSAMRLAAVYACVRVLAESFAMLPLRFYRRREDGGRDLVTNHWLYQLLAKAPNDYQTPFEFFEMLEGHIALRGNAFCEIESKSNGQIKALWPIHPDAVQCITASDGSYKFTVSNTDGTQRTLLPGDMWHIKGLATSGFLGLGPIEAAAESIGLGLAAQSYGARFFANDTKPGGWIEMSGRFADDAAKKTFLSSWRASNGGPKRGGTAVLESGMKYHELKLNNAESQFLESRKFSRAEIAGIFRVSPHLIQDLERATFSNLEQQSLDFVMHNLTPRCERWEASIERWLLPSGDADIEVEFDVDNLLRGDQASRAAYYTALINCGVLVRNEARLREGLNPLPGLGAPLQPLNMVEVGAAQDKQTKADKSTDDQPAQAPGKPAPVNGTAQAHTRLHRLLAGNAARMAKRIVSGNLPPADVLAEALCLPSTAEASAWLAAVNPTVTEAELAQDLLNLAQQF